MQEIEPWDYLVHTRGMYRKEEEEEEEEEKTLCHLQ